MDSAVPDDIDDTVERQREEEIYVHPYPSLRAELANVTHITDIWDTHVNISMHTSQ
jgi:hypothetical protein